MYHLLMIDFCDIYHLHNDNNNSKFNIPKKFYEYFIQFYPEIRFNS